MVAVIQSTHPNEYEAMDCSISGRGMVRGRVDRGCIAGCGADVIEVEFGGDGSADEESMDACSSADVGADVANRNPSPR